MENIKEYTATKLRQYRAVKNISLSEVAEKTGLDKNTISRYESGKYNMQLDIVEKLLNFYEVPYTIFFSQDYANNHKLV